MPDAKTFVDHFNTFVSATDEERRSSRQVRDYLDHKQWTHGELVILRSRRQSPITKNIMRRKHDTLAGIERRQRQSPRALPRKPGIDDDVSDAASESIRYVWDNTEMDQQASDVFDECLAEGYSGTVIEIDDDGNIVLVHVPFDRIYFDIHSRKRDFSDAMYMGITIWMFASEARRRWPEHEAAFDSGLGGIGNDDETFEDRPRWEDNKESNNPRVRINQEFYFQDDEWWQVFYTNGLVLEEPEVVVYKDDTGETVNPMELQSHYVGRNNERYGIDKGMVSAQDEVNARTTKALHMLSSKTVISDPGVVADSTKVMNDLTTGQAYIEKQTQGALEVDSNQELSQGQLLMLQDATNFLDDFGPNEVIVGKEAKTLSGVALAQRESAGMTEISHLYDSHSAWKKRVYRQIWYRIKQFWKCEKWIRVTGESDNCRFVGINRKLTNGELLTRSTLR